MEKEQKTGKINYAEYVKTTDKGWKSYDMTLDDGSVYKAVGIPPDVTLSLEKGVEVTLQKTRFSWMVVKVEDDEKPIEKKGDSNDKPKKSTSFTESRDEFNRYQIQERDPKIERQTYVRMALDFYAVCLPFFEKQPKNSLEADALFRDAVSLGDAEYQRAINRK